MGGDPASPPRVSVRDKKGRRWGRGYGFVALCLIVTVAMNARGAEELLPKYITPPTQKAIKNGLDYLAKAQSPDGNFPNSPDGADYAVTMTSLAGMAFLANGNTPNRGPYADNVKRVESFVMQNANPNGLICTPNEFNGKSMYGHGFGLLFLSSVYGMETDEKVRDRMKTIITNGIDLTCKAQYNGGWTYVPGGGDEGSVTITQMQALRAAQNAGFSVPKGTVEEATRYLERCQNPDGGIIYQVAQQGTESRLAISAAAIACLYNAGDYDSKMADACLAYVDKQFQINANNWSKGGGHDYYTHLYASQAFYQAGDKYWDNYFPGARDQLLKQQGHDGSFPGDVGPVYGTSIALIILQLPYKFLPIYQR